MSWKLLSTCSRQTPPRVSREVSQTFEAKHGGKCGNKKLEALEGSHTPTQKSQQLPSMLPAKSPKPNQNITKPNICNHTPKKPPPECHSATAPSASLMCLRSSLLIPSQLLRSLHMGEVSDFGSSASLGLQLLFSVPFRFFGKFRVLGGCPRSLRMSSWIVFPSCRGGGRPRTSRPQRA